MLFRKIESLKTEERRGLFSGVLWSQVCNMREDIRRQEDRFTYHWSDAVRLRRAHGCSAKEATLAHSLSININE